MKKTQKPIISTIGAQATRIAIQVLAVSRFALIVIFF